MLKGKDLPWTSEGFYIVKADLLFASSNIGIVFHELSETVL